MHVYALFVKIMSLMSVFSKALEGLKLSRTSPVGEWDSPCNGLQHACL